jgi:hypothetical protein
LLRGQHLRLKRKRRKLERVVKRNRRARSNN